MATSYEDRILRVLAYIHDNPGEDLSLDQLADVAAMSRFHWHRVFRAITGETCAQAVRRTRLHLAAERLVRGTDPVGRIAASVGYPDAAAFSRAFSDIYGQSPLAYRKAGRLRPVTFSQITGDSPMFDVTLRTASARQVVAMPHKGPYPEIGQAFEAFGAIAASRNLWPMLGATVALYLDNPETTPEGELRSFAGAVWTGGDTPDGLERIDMAAGRVAVLTFTGPYTGLQTAYEDLYGRWLPQSGEEPADAPSYEVYLNDPRNTPPAELVTEICMPLKG